MKFKKFIKKNSVPLILFVLVLAIIVVALLFVGLFVPTNKLGEYGNRLVDVADYPIENATINSVKEEALKSFDEATLNIEGRIIYIKLYTDSVKRSDAKKATDSLFGNFSEAQLKYYDFQIAVSNTSEENGYTMFGSRNHGKTETVWTNDSE